MTNGVNKGEDVIVNVNDERLDVQISRLITGSEYHLKL